MEHIIVAQKFRITKNIHKEIIEQDVFAKDDLTQSVL